MITIEEIKKEAKKQGYTQESLAKKMGLTRNSISKWFMGFSKPTDARYEQLLEILGFYNHMTKCQNTLNSSYYSNIIKEVKTLKKIPVINYVQAGEFTQQSQNIEPLRYEIIEMSQSLPENGFALEVRGSSMKFDYSPSQLLDERLAKYSIKDGELVIVDTSKTNPSDLLNKVVVAINSDGTTVKLIYEDEKGLCLMPLNSLYQTQDNIKRPNEATIIGRVVKVITPSRDF